jgi:hypothetical protein
MRVFVTGATGFHSEEDRKVIETLGVKLETPEGD